MNKHGKVTSSRTLYVMHRDIPVEVLSKYMKEKVETQVKKIYGKDVPFIFNPIVDREGKGKGASYLFTSILAAKDLLSSFQAFEEAKEKANGVKDGWEDEKEKEVKVKKMEAVVVEKKTKLPSWLDDDDDITPPPSKKVETGKKEEIVKKIEKGQIIFEPIVIEGSEKDFWVCPCEIHYNDNVNPNALFCPKVPYSVKEKDIADHFKVFASNPKATDSRGRSYPQVTKTENDNVYVNFQPGTDDAYCASVASMKCNIGKYFLIFKLAEKNKKRYNA